MFPRVSSNDITTLVPVYLAESVQTSDIVFCEVQPGSRILAHLVKDKGWRNGVFIFTISDMRGREDGWCRIGQIFGKLIDARP